MTSCTKAQTAKLDAQAEARKGSFFLMMSGETHGVVTCSYGLATLPLGSVPPSWEEDLQSWADEMVRLSRALGDDIPHISPKELRTRFIGLIETRKLIEIPRSIPLEQQWRLDAKSTVRWVVGRHKHRVLVFRNDEIGDRYHWWCADYYASANKIFAYFDAGTGIMYVAIFKPAGAEQYYCQAVHLLKAREIGMVYLHKSLVEGKSEEK